MSVNFSFQPLQQPDFGQSLDSIFNNVLRSQVAQKQMEAQTQQIQSQQLQDENMRMQMQNAQAQQMLQYGQFGFQPSDVTPQNVSGALQASQGFNQAPPMLQNPQGPQGGSPIQSAIANYFQAQNASRMLGIQKERAGIGAQEAEANAKNTDAAKNQAYLNLINGGGQGGGMSDIISQVKSGNLAPSQISETMGRDPLARLAIGMQMSRQGVNEADLQTKFDAKQKLAEAGAVPIANTQTLQSSLDVLEDLNNDFRRDYPQFVNKSLTDVAANLKPNSKEGRAANRLLMQSKIAADLFQNNFGAGSNEKLELAQSLSNPKQATSQMGDTIRLMRADMQNRVSAYRGQQGTEKPEFSDKQAKPTLKSDKGFHYTVVK